MSKTTIVNVGYRSTNYWVISAGSSRLLVDLGWPGQMGTMRANLSYEDPALVAASWRILREHGATSVYPGHGPVQPLDPYYVA